MLLKIHLMLSVQLGKVASESGSLSTVRCYYRILYHRSTGYWLHIIRKESTMKTNNETDNMDDGGSGGNATQRPAN